MSLDMVTRTINSANGESIGEEVAAELEETGYVNGISEDAEGMAARVFQPALEPSAVNGTQRAAAPTNLEAGCVTTANVVISKMAFHLLYAATDTAVDIRVRLPYLNKSLPYNPDQDFMAYESRPFLDHQVP